MCLSNLTEDHWKSDHDATIMNFLQDISQYMLVFYYDSQSEELFLNDTFPTGPVKELSYFIKTRNEIVTSENFLDIVQFGSLLPAHTGGLLKTMHGLYSPTFFMNTTWPSSIL